MMFYVSKETHRLFVDFISVLFPFVFYLLLLRDFGYSLWSKQFSFRPDFVGISYEPKNTYLTLDWIIHSFKSESLYEDIVIDLESVGVVGMKLVSTYWLTSLVQVKRFISFIWYWLSEDMEYKGKRYVVKRKRQAFKRFWYVVMVSERLRRDSRWVKHLVKRNESI